MRQSATRKRGLQLLADIVDKETRSRMMKAIRGKDTKPELILRRALHGQGFRFRLHVSALPGKPDIVLSRFKAAVNVHGCFWHQHEGCPKAYIPSTNKAKWLKKFADNKARDKRNEKALGERGWREATVWECALTKTRVEETTRLLVEWLLSGEQRIEIPEVIDHDSRT